MKNIDIVIPVISAQYSELTPAQQHLVDEARAATLRSYAPYSRFNVGAAILLSDGTVVTGANQETPPSPPAPAPNAPHATTPEPTTPTPDSRQ